MNFNPKFFIVCDIHLSQPFFKMVFREEVVNGLCGHKQKTMSTTIYFKGGFPPDLLYEEGISKLNFEGINFGKLKIDWKKFV